MRSNLILILGLILGGCSSRLCSADFRFGITVKVLDAQSSEQILCGVKVDIIDGKYIESLTEGEEEKCYDDFDFSGAGERPGVYQVIVSKQGYETWISDEIRVKSTPDKCHVIHNLVTADLVRSE